MIPAVIERCAGIDAGKKSLAVCVMTGDARDEAKAELRSFGTVRAELVRLRQWLQREGCTHVVMESTGCYWKPVLNILEDDPEYGLRIVLANAQQVKAVTGHKTDPHDARWLAHLLRHGMIRPSFVPPRAQRELRDLTRRRKQMVRTAAEERNRVQQVLEDANVKIGDVLSDVFGLSGQLMLEALVAGRSSVDEVAELARGNARKKLDTLKAALEGHQMRDSHRFLITRAMRHLAFLADEIEALDDEIAQTIGAAGLSEPLARLQTIPGIGGQAAAAMLAEGGPDMKVFPTAGSFSSWSGVVIPGLKRPQFPGDVVGSGQPIGGDAVRTLYQLLNVSLAGMPVTRYDLRQRQVLTLSWTVYRMWVVFLLSDLDTQRVWRPYIVPKTQLIRPEVANYVAGRVNRADRFHVVLEAVRSDAKHVRYSTVPVPANGAGGPPIG